MEVRRFTAKLDESSRSRGLLFIATAVYVAAGYGAPEAVVPENVQLAINPPLSPARMASASTRSVHPRVLRDVNRLVELLGGAVKVVNPLHMSTKGDVCALALSAGLSADDLFETISCGHPPFLHVDPLPRHCGLCVACLLRRSGLHAALGYDRTEYQFSPTDTPDTAAASGRLDVAAMARWSAAPFGIRDLLGDQPLPPTTDYAGLLAILERGRGEIRRMLNTFAGPGASV